MIAEKAFSQLLQLDERWEVTAAEFETVLEERFVVAVRETAKLWPSLRCPESRCGGTEAVCHDHAEARSWRHPHCHFTATAIIADALAPQGRKTYGRWDSEKHPKPPGWAKIGHGGRQPVNRMPVGDGLIQMVENGDTMISIRGMIFRTGTITHGTRGIRGGVTYIR